MTMMRLLPNSVWLWHKVSKSSKERCEMDRSECMVAVTKARLSIATSSKPKTTSTQNKNLHHIKKSKNNNNNNIVIDNNNNNINRSVSLDHKLRRRLMSLARENGHTMKTSTENIETQQDDNNSLDQMPPTTMTTQNNNDTPLSDGDFVTSFDDNKSKINADATHGRNDDSGTNSEQFYGLKSLKNTYKLSKDETILEKCPNLNDITCKVISEESGERKLTFKDKCLESLYLSQNNYLKQIENNNNNNYNTDKNKDSLLDKKMSKQDKVSDKYDNNIYRCYPNSTIDYQIIFDENNLKDSIKNHGGIQKVKNEDLWSLVCSDLRLPSYNINMVNYIRQYSLYLHHISTHKSSFVSPDQNYCTDDECHFKNIYHPITNFELHTLSKTSHSFDPKYPKSTIKYLKKKLHSGLIHEIDFALNIIIHLFHHRETECMELIINDIEIISALFIIAGVKYRGDSLTLTNNSMDDCEHANSFYMTWTKSEIFKKQNTFNFWKKHLMNSEINSELLNNILTFDAKRDKDKPYNINNIHSKIYFTKYTYNFFNFNDSYQETINRIAAVFTILINISKIYTSKNKLSSSNVMQFFHNTLYLSILGYHSDIQLIHSLSIDALIEISNVIDLSYFKPNSKTSNCSPNSDDHIHFNYLIYDEISKILANDLKSSDASCILASLNIISNLTGNSNSENNVLLFDAWFLECESNLQSFLNCLLLMSISDKESDFSTFEVIRIFASEIIHNMSFFSTNILLHDNFIIIHTICVSLKYLIPLCAAKLRQKNMILKANQLDEDASNRFKSLISMHDSILDHLICQMSVILKNLVKHYGHCNLEIPGLVSHIILTLQLSIGRHDRNLDLLLGRLLVEKQKLFSNHDHMAV